MGYNRGMTSKVNLSKHGCWWGWLIVGCLLVVLSPLILRGIGAVLIHADPLEKVDVAVALSGDKGDRLSEAAWLYNQNYVEGLVITYTTDTARDVLFSAAIQQGIPEKRIYVTSLEAINTIDEANAVKQLAEEDQFDSLMIITDPFHTLRTRLIFRKVFRESGIVLQVRPVSGHWYRSTTWWKSKEGIDLTIQEYVKVLLFFLGLQ